MRDVPGPDANRKIIYFKLTQLVGPRQQTHGIDGHVKLGTSSDEERTEALLSAVPCELHRQEAWLKQTCTINKAALWLLINPLVGTKTARLRGETCTV